MNLFAIRTKSIYCFSYKITRLIILLFLLNHAYAETAIGLFNYSYDEVSAGIETHFSEGIYDRANTGSFIGYLNPEIVRTGLRWGCIQKTDTDPYTFDTCPYVQNLDKLVQLGFNIQPTLKTHSDNKSGFNLTKDPDPLKGAASYSPADIGAWNDEHGYSEDYFDLVTAILKRYCPSENSKCLIDSLVIENEANATEFWAADPAFSDGTDDESIVIDYFKLLKTAKHAASKLYRSWSYPDNPFRPKIYTSGMTSGGLLWLMIEDYEKTSSVTITNANPAVITWIGHGLATDDLIRFSTDGSLPAGLSEDTNYYVQNSTTNTFEVSGSPSGTSIETTSAGSGTHTGINQNDAEDLHKRARNNKKMFYDYNGVGNSTKSIEVVLADRLDDSDGKDFDVTRTRIMVETGADIEQDGNPVTIFSNTLSDGFNFHFYHAPTALDDFITFFRTGIADANNGDSYAIDLLNNETGINQDYVDIGEVITISNGSPGVITWEAHNLPIDTVVRFTTSNALPAGLLPDTDYYVRSPSTDTFEVSTSAGGSSINTTSDGNGTHWGTVPVQITNGTDAVITWTSHGLADNKVIRFITTGALPSGLETDTDYYVHNPTTHTFNLTSNPADTNPLDTSSAGSGTHTGLLPTPYSGPMEDVPIGANNPNKWMLYLITKQVYEDIDKVIWFSEDGSENNIPSLLNFDSYDKPMNDVDSPNINMTKTLISILSKFSNATASNEDQNLSTSYTKSFSFNNDDINIYFTDIDHINRVDVNPTCTDVSNLINTHATSCADTSTAYDVYGDTVGSCVTNDLPNYQALTFVCAP